MKKGIIRNIYPGGNTSKGFYSFYSYVAREDADKIFYVKGGPGVGKSTFIKGIGMDLIDRGLDVEFLYCSSDNDSLDGVYVPDVDAGVIDGTAPHMIDPKNPGAVDEIINLGEFWDEGLLRENRQDIIRLNREIGRLFRRVYSHLKGAKLFLDELENCILDAGALDIKGLNRKAVELIDRIFDNETLKNKDGSGRCKIKTTRHLFATAITPQGPSSFLKNLFDPVKKRIIIKGHPGSGKNTILQKIAGAAVSLGLKADIFHCSLDPDKVEHIIIPEIDTGVITSAPPHEYASGERDIVVNTDEFVDFDHLEPYQSEMEKAQKRYSEIFSDAVAFLAKAKELHDELEKYYTSSMDFKKVEVKREEVVERILKLK